MENVTVLTSEKLTQLQNDREAAWVKMAGLPSTSPEAKDALLAVFAIDKQITAEEAAIRKTENDAKVAEARNARLSLLENLLNSHRSVVTLSADKKASEEDKTAAQDAFTAARDIVANELLARFATSAPAKKAANADGTDKPAAPKGSTSAAITERFIANRQAGMDNTANVKAIIAEGFSRGTTGAVVLAYRRSIGEAE